MIRQAESPVASPKGRWLACLREDSGRDSIWLRALDQSGSRDRRLTPVEFNVLEMSFFAELLPYLLLLNRIEVVRGFSYWTSLDLFAGWV